MNNINEFLNLKAKNLSLQEVEYLSVILNELQETGTSSALDAIWMSDYEEKPVDIIEFITNPRYFGKSLTDTDGNIILYPYWVDTIKDIFKSNSNVQEVALSGAIGVGKTTVACIGIGYMLYKLLCLKNPASYYKLTSGSKIAIAFFNLSLDQVYGVGYSRLQKYMQNSEWFLEHGTLIGRTYPTYYPGKDIEILTGSKMEHFIGRDIFAGMLDELDFAKGQDASIEKSSILKLYNTVKRRIESRFMKLGTVPGILFMCSSKNHEYDFLETYINSNRSKPTLKIIDEPVWEIKKGLGLYSGKTFNVAVGNRYFVSRILRDDEDPEVITANGQRVIAVPVEHRDAFELDITTALADIAGIAISTASKFFIMDKVISCYKSYLKNPFTTDEIMLGFDDSTQIKDYLIESLLPKLSRSSPCYVHWDTSTTGDKTGLSMTTVASDKVVKRLVKGSVGKVTDVVHKLIFGIKVKPKPGEEIPYYKIRNFIYYLRDIGFNIVSVSCDGYQSTDTIQQFKIQGLNAEVLSVDRTKDPYITARNAINEGRVIMPYIKILEDEFADVEDSKTKNKVDHTTIGSKDLLDTVVANIYKASRSYAPSLNNGINPDVLLAVNTQAVDSDDLDLDSMVLGNNTVIDSGNRIYN